MLRNSIFSKTAANWFLRARYDLKIGKGSHCCIKSRFEGRNAVFENTEISRSELGFATYVANNSVIRKTQIGRFCSIGDWVRTCIGVHPSRGHASTHPAFFSLNDPAKLNLVNRQLFDEHKFVDQNNKYVVRIGNDVWIGNNVILFDGVTVGDGAIIGAGSIVTKDVEPYTIVAGVPAVKLRQRFSEDQTSNLLALKWWNWDIGKIKENSELFISVDELLASQSRPAQPYSS